MVNVLVWMPCPFARSLDAAETLVLAAKEALRKLTRLRIGRNFSSQVRIWSTHVISRMLGL